jgi:tripartite-type tricarboxylate transporter receptor subunit TctC
MTKIQCIQIRSAWSRLGKFILVWFTLFLVSSAFAQPQSGKPVRLIVGYAAGGGADILARLMVPRLAEALGQPVMVDNRPGAGGTIAAAQLAASAPDGQTLYFSDAGFVTAPGIYDQLPYDPNLGIAPVANVASLPLAFSVHPSVAATTPAELIALLKANPDKYSYGSPGIGTLHHLSAELIKKQTGIRMTHIPYKGAAPALTDLIGGQIPLAITSATAALGHAGSGKLRVIGLSSRERISSAPSVATMAEGLQGFSATNDLFVLAPGGTSTATIARINAAVKVALSSKELQESFLAQGAIVEWTSTEDLAIRIKRDIERWRSIAKEASIRAQ